MTNQYDDRGRMFRNDDERERWDRDRWERDEENYGSRPPEGYGASDRDRWEERDWDRGIPDRAEGRRFGRYYGRFGRMEGVGSAAGYSGMGGPGWTAGGFGDPGYGTSGFGSSDYGTSRSAGYHTRPSSEPMPMSREGGRGWQEPDYSRAGYGRPAERWDGDSRASYERSNIGPYAGRGPRGYQRSDERIREEVSERLTDDDRIDASGIEVAVAGGEVTLTGTVESRRMKRHAEDLAESVRGVRDVHNQLRVGEATKEDHEFSLSPEAEQLRKQAK